MGYNPAKPPPTKPTPQQFSISLLSDVYKAIEREYGKDWALAHIAVAATYLDENGNAELQLMGRADKFQALVGMLIIRLAQEYAFAEIAKAKKQGKEITVDLKATCKQILDRAWEKIKSLESLS